MRRLLWLVLLLGSLTLLVVACGGAQPAAEEQEPETVEVEREVTVVVTVEGETVTETITETVTEVITATPEPTEVVEAGPKTMVICMAQEPNSLFWAENALVTSAVLEAIQEPTIDLANYGYAANTVEALPSEEEGTYSLEEVTVSEGDQIYDVATDTVLTLTAGMTESFSLNQLEGDPLVVEAWDGSDLTTVQQTASWTLVEGLTWEDGTPVTAADSVFGFEVARDPNYPGADKYTADRTASYTADDERTVTWTSMPGYIAGDFFVNIWTPRPSHVLEGMDVAALLEDESVNRDPLSYGPYVMDEWVAGESMTLSPNPNYFRGEVPLDTLIFRFVGDTNQMIAQLASGECDMGTQDAAFEGSLPLIRGFEEQGLMEVVEVIGTVFEHIDFNIQPVEGYTGASATLLDNEGGRLFANVNFRKAIAQCIDRQAIIDQATNGAAGLQHTYIPSVHPLYPGDDAVTVYEFDPAAGLELLAGLGWTDTDGDGVLDNGAGQELSFIHSTRVNPLRTAVTQIIQAQLAENCQVQTEIELIGSEYFSPGAEGPLYGRRFDLAEFAWLTGVEPSCELYITEQIPAEENGFGLQNAPGFSNPEFDDACNRARAALDEEEKAAAHAEAMAIWTDQVPSLPLFARTKLAVIRPGVEGVIMDPTINSELWNVENFDVNFEE